MNGKLTITYEERPHFVNPINAMAGLYMNVLASARCEHEKLLEFVEADVRKAGYKPYGRAMVGMPTQHGVLSMTYAMWFYDKA